MGEPIVKASGRTFYAIGTYVSDPHWISPWVESTHSLNLSTQSPSEALKSGLPMAVYSTARSIYSFPSISMMMVPYHLETS
jgi:hypothetical protein